MLFGSRRLWRPSSVWHPMAPPLAVLAQQEAEAANLIEQDVPEVKLRRRQVQIVGRPSMMHDGASPRTALPGNMGVIEMTSATSLKIGGALGSEHHPHHGSL
jgi:hypothetical protein